MILVALDDYQLWEISSTDWRISDPQPPPLSARPSVLTVVILDGNAQFKSKATPTQHMGSLKMEKRRGPSTESRGTPQVKLT